MDMKLSTDVFATDGMPDHYSIHSMVVLSVVLLVDLHFHNLNGIQKHLQ